MTTKQYPKSYVLAHRIMGSTLHYMMHGGIDRPISWTPDLQEAHVLTGSLVLDNAMDKIKEDLGDEQPVLIEVCRVSMTELDFWKKHVLPAPHAYSGGQYPELLQALHLMPDEPQRMRLVTEVVK